MGDSQKDFLNDSSVIYPNNTLMGYPSDGEVLMPITLSKTETILHIIFISQGIPINVIIGVVIIVNRRLHSPRNTFWLGIIALNLLTIFMAVLRLLVVHVEGTQTPSNSTVYNGNEEGVICLTFSFMTGKPYTILLFILLLATLDRYVAITYPLFHRKHITVRLVIIIQVSCILLVFGLMSLPFIFGWVPRRCGFNLSLGMWNMLGRSFLVILCVIAQIKVYYQTRKYLNQHWTLNQEQPTNQDPNTVAIPMKVMNSKSQQQASSSDNTNQQEGQSGSHAPTAPAGNNSSNSTTGMRSATFFVHRGNKSVSKLELEASRTLIIGILSLFIITAPMFIVYFSISICQQLGVDCSRLTVSVPYVRQTALIHAVYGPLIYMIRSREFSLAVRQMLRARSKRLSSNYV